VIGVPSRAALPLVAGALAALGCEHALVVHSRDGLDEISLGAPTDAIEVRGERLEERTLDAAAFGLSAASSEALHAASASGSAAMVRAAIAGETAGDAGARSDVVLANAAAALYVAGLAATLPDGVTRARESVRSGAARDVLERLARFTTNVGEPARDG
jgi:anthranilate phosphoribosyltransferase